MSNPAGTVQAREAVREPVPTLVDYLPILTTAISAVFAAVVLRRWSRRGYPPHLGWWGAGLMLYGIGTLTESYTTLFGWSPVVFKAWYIAGALLGGAPLAQGTAYLLLRKRRTAHILAGLMLLYVAIAAAFVIASPLDLSKVEPHSLSGDVLAWSWVRLFSPFVNTYAVIFLIGGAILSAWRFRKHASTRDRMVGNILIAIGAILPGIGGGFSRAGHTEVLYVGEFVGILLIFLGYRYNVRDRPLGAGGERTRLAAGKTVSE